MISYNMRRESVLLRLMGFVETMLGQTNGQLSLINDFEKLGGKVTLKNLRQLKIIYEAGSVSASDINTALGNISDHEFLKQKIKNGKG